MYCAAGLCFKWLLTACVFSSVLSGLHGALCRGDPAAVFPSREHPPLPGVCRLHEEHQCRSRWKSPWCLPLFSAHCALVMNDKLSKSLNVTVTHGAQSLCCVHLWAPAACLPAEGWPSVINDLKWCNLSQSWSESEPRFESLKKNEQKCRINCRGSSCTLVNVGFDNNNDDMRDYISVYAALFYK